MTDMHPIPTANGIITVTPDMAKSWLHHRNIERNRTFSQRLAAEWADAMRNGKWKTTHQGIAFDWDGFLLDGQHRLGAIVIVDKPVDLDIRVGCDPATFDVLDTGRKRNARQLVKHTHANIISPAARFLGSLDGTITTGFIRRGIYATSPTIAEVLQTLEKWPETDRLAASASYCRTRGQILASPHLAVLAQAQRSQYANRIPMWLDGLAHGEGLSGTDPRLHLRTRFAADRRALAQGVSQPLAYALIVKAWNAFATDTAMGILRFRSDEEIPAVVA